MLDKRAKIIMLPTKDETNIVVSAGKLVLAFKGVHKLCNPEKLIYQHLYFTTNEEIKEGNLFIRNISGNLGVEQYIKDDHLYSNDRKIVATTDESLSPYIKGDWDVHEVTGSQKYYHLPQSSQAFIEAYCKAGGIDEVDVEYQSKCSKTGTECGDNVNCQHMCDKFILKVDSHNTITIHPIKNSWSRKEVIELCYRMFNENFGVDWNGFDNWIKKNL